MRDAEGDRLAIEVIPYRVRGGQRYTETICITVGFDGYLIPLAPDQARKLARKLAKAADALDVEQ